MNAALMASAQGDWVRAEEILRGLVATNPDDFVVSHSSWFLLCFPRLFLFFLSLELYFITPLPCLGLRRLSIWSAPHDGACPRPSPPRGREPRHRAARPRPVVPSTSVAKRANYSLCSGTSPVLDWGNSARCSSSNGAAVHFTYGVMIRALPTVYVMVARGPKLFVLDRPSENSLIEFRTGEWGNLDLTDFFVSVFFFPTPADLVSFCFRSCLHSKLSFVLRLISVYVFFVQTRKAVNNLGVALLSQGKLKEVRLCSFWCVPRLWCSLHVIAAFTIYYWFVCVQCAFLLTLSFDPRMAWCPLVLPQ